uniref:hypothetical protein n=1 Tax=Catenibacterium mitsuokai TaxID=100886 RepID=UPI003D782E7D
HGKLIMSQLGHYQLGYIETLSHWNQNVGKCLHKLILTNIMISCRLLIAMKKTSNSYALV